eukprot:708422-Rhodomonas_salina.1
MERAACKPVHTIRQGFTAPAAEWPPHHKDTQFCEQSHAHAKIKCRTEVRGVAAAQLKVSWHAFRTVQPRAGVSGIHGNDEQDQVQDQVQEADAEGADAKESVGTGGRVVNHSCRRRGEPSLSQHFRDRELRLHPGQSAGNVLQLIALSMHMKCADGGWCCQKC